MSEGGDTEETRNDQGTYSNWIIGIEIVIARGACRVRHVDGVVNLQLV